MLQCVCVTSGVTLICFLTAILTSTYVNRYFKTYFVDLSEVKLKNVEVEVLEHVTCRRLLGENSNSAVIGWVVCNKPPIRLMCLMSICQHFCFWTLT